MAKKEIETGEFGPIYRQFEKKPREAMKYLEKKKTGECINALYREDIGFVDIVWGRPDDLDNGISGFGLSHIIKDHGDEIKDFKLSPIDFILFIFFSGQVLYSGNKHRARIFIEDVNHQYRMILTTEWHGVNKKLLLTTFDLRPIASKNPKRAKQLTKKASKKGGSL